MILRNIEILNFKNIPEADLTFSEGVNCFLGENGMGKSNLLEAIHFLCLARGMSSMPESALIRHGEQLAGVKGSFLMENGGEEKISAGLAKGKAKSFKRNGKEYDRISAHIGAFPLVCVTPADSMLVSGSGELRRRLMDVVLSQADKSYLSSLIRYNKALESRNRMLRAGVRDKILYEAVETSMIDSSRIIHEKRGEWIRNMAPVLSNYYGLIADNREAATISYRSVLNDRSAEDMLAEYTAKDFALGFTSQGVHRDDLTTGLGEYSMRRLGSQGQVKTFTIALRFAIFDYLKSIGGRTPLLLLDDIFDKLDAGRVERIMDLVSKSENFKQIFITDTNRKHLDDILSHIPGEASLFNVDNGIFKPLSITDEQ